VRYRPLHMWRGGERKERNKGSFARIRTPHMSRLLVKHDFYPGAA
jgi:hypothetical protein